MQLTKISIENFRGIAKLELELDSATVLIGENNTGKTSVLEVLNICLTAPPIMLTLTFEETAKGEWPDEVVQALSGAIQVMDDERQRVTLRVTAAYDSAISNFDADWTFLDLASNELPSKPRSLIADLQRLAPVFVLTAMRDSSQHFQARSAFWGPFTRNPRLDESKRKEIEEQVSQINQSVLDNHEPFEIVRERIAQTGKLVPLSSTDPVSVEAVPARIQDMLARTQVKLSSRTGARLPLEQHGSGTQSLSVLFLFEAFLQSRLAEAFDKHAEPILALEEPESHLHPSAIRALWPTLESLAGQKLIATHSGDLVSVVPLTNIRRLARTGGQVRVFSVKPGRLDADEERKVAYHVRAKRGALMFAKCWLLVEGESEFTVIPEFARIRGEGFDQAVVSCVEIAQCGVAPLIKVADDLGIEWHLIVDGDPDGQRKAKTAETLLGSRSRNDRITVLTEPDIEHCLWNAGYAHVYEKAVSAKYEASITAAKGTEQYADETIKAAVKSLGKPHLAYLVALEASKPAAPGVPSQIQSAIEMCIELAGSST